MFGWSRGSVRTGGWLAVLLLPVLVAGCSRRSDPTPEHTAPSRTLRLSQRNEPADLDPATAQLPDDFFIIRALGEGLLIPDAAGGNPQPGLAEGYDVTPNGLAYTFHLRPGLQWSNGEELTAADLVASYRRVLDPTTAAPKASLFYPVKNARAFATGALRDFSAVGIRAVDARTILITLAHPTAKFPWYVASGAWIPVNPRVVAAWGRAWTQPAHYVGNGPFTLAVWAPQQRIVVKKNARFRAADRVRLDAIEFLRFDNDDTEERAFRAGQVDVTMSLPKTKIPAYAAERESRLHRLPLAETRFITFNLRRAPLDDPRVRQALSRSIDRARLIEHVLLGRQQPATRLVSPALRDDTVTPAASDVTTEARRARALLAAAGYPGGRGFPRLELSTWSPSQIPLLEAIQAMWREELGIRVALVVREAKVHLDALGRGDYDLGFATTIEDVADAAAVLQDFTAGAPNNFPGWQSASFDELLASAARLSTPAARWPVLLRAESILLEACPVTPLYFNVQNWLMSPRVHGWQQDALWNRNYTGIYLDER